MNQEMTQEKDYAVHNAFIMIAIITFLWMTITFGALTVHLFVAAIPTAIALWALTGLRIVKPNEALVVSFFGTYKGTSYETGMVYVNPLCSIEKVSLRLNSFTSDIVKVNDKRGNPLDLAVFAAWKIKNPACAVFNVEDVDNFVSEQVGAIFSEEVPKYAFDSNDTEEQTFRRNVTEIAQSLEKVLQSRLEVVGVEVVELRFIQYCYSQEIAKAMLQKQQAEALLEARNTLVNGTHGIVENLIEAFEKSKTVKLSNEDKSRLAINLMLVLVSEKEATPVINIDK